MRCQWKRESFQVISVKLVRETLFALHLDKEDNYDFLLMFVERLNFVSLLHAFVEKLPLLLHLVLVGSHFKHQTKINFQAMKLISVKIYNYRSLFWKIQRINCICTFDINKKSSEFSSDFPMKKLNQEMCLIFSLC